MMSARLHQLILMAIRACAGRPLRALMAAVGLVIASLAYVSVAFDMTTDTGELISAKTPWRQDGAAIEAAFPQIRDSVLVVVDGQTPELAEDAAIRLSAKLAQDKAHVIGVRRPDGGAFFDQNGLLFASLPEVQDTTRRLIDAQPLLGGLAADPSLRGIAKTLDTVADGALHSPADAGRLAVPMRALSDAIDGDLAGRKTFFSWQRLFSGSTGTMAPPTRRLLMVLPRMQYGELEPGAEAVAAISTHAARLGLDGGHGVRVGITGEVPLADEEFASIREGMGVIGAVMVIAMLVCLWLATRSARSVAAILITIVAGLVITLALGLLAVGRLNLISVAFIPLFVGLGVDFGIQVAVRFNAERHGGADPLSALERMAHAIGEPLSLAAGAIFLALGAFLPTDYIGIAELGVIAGVGMVIAFVLNITLLPALLILMRPAVPAARVGWAGAAPMDAWLHRHRRSILIAFVGAMALSIMLLAWVRFDFNPLHLRNPQSPAMRELSNLMRDAERTPNTIAVLSPNAAQAAALASRLQAHPEVARAISIDSFVPEGQALKLALISDASLLLDAAVNPFDLPAPADDASTLAALTKASVSLNALADARGGELGDAARRLARSFAALAAGTPAQRAAAEHTLVPPLTLTLDKLRASLTASEITRDNLPPELVADWLAKDGRALVQVTPAGNSTDNAVLERFTRVVRAEAPRATGMPIATQEAAKTVAWAFIQAGILALVLVSGLLWLVLRSLREVAFTLAPVVLSGFLTLGTCVVIGQPLNFANIIAFPLLFGVGVAFHIYFVMAWRRGIADLLQTSLARAVVCSALATGSAFGALWFSAHPGTASMGLILMISLIWTLICALIFEPALLGPVPAGTPQAQEPD
ncbi:MMPL family transporter [Novosphingobium sp. FSY-8]|uniref:MMPL family transporter n=1 Tax=Novosphingobium ovatum TaxID=1908523 RepID=A0ABW9XH23_9SPHN|nr:MMPL family transporter [Novosphingobium ovatum]NBC37857.1 MMPL family transporter [Novosphingobium ovatum]